VLMLAANSALTSSSASSERIQSQVALAKAEFFCGAKPFHGSVKTLAPCARARAKVWSVLPESTTMISPAMPSMLFSVRTMFASSLRVMMQTERVMDGDFKFEILNFKFQICADGASSPFRQIIGKQVRLARQVVSTS